MQGQVEQVDISSELRSKMEGMWREFSARAQENGIPPQIVSETMTTVALEQLVSSSGPYEAATYLRLLADAIFQQGRDQDAKLMEGDDP